MAPNSSANRIFWSVDVIPVTTKIRHFKVVKPLVSRHHRVIMLNLAPHLYFKRELHRKMMTRKIGNGFLIEIKELELYYMEPDYMSIKGHKRGHGTSSNLEVVVKSHMMLFHMAKIVKGSFMSLGLVFPHSFINVDT